MDVALSLRIEWQTLSLWQNGGGYTEDKGWGCLLNKSSRSQVALIIQALILVSRQRMRPCFAALAHLCNNVPLFSNPSRELFSAAEWEAQNVHAGTHNYHLSFFLFLCALVHISGGCVVAVAKTHRGVLQSFCERHETWLAHAPVTFIYMRSSSSSSILYHHLSLYAGEPFSCTQNVNARGAKCDFLLV